MKTSRLLFVSKPRARNCRTGAIVPLFAIMLPVVLILSAFAINIAYLQLNRTEIYIAADAASRAASREFAKTNSSTSAIAAARTATARNTVGGSPLLLSHADIVFGESSRDNLENRYSFSASNRVPNAVEVRARRDSGSVSGAIKIPLPLFFSSPTINASQTSRSSRIELDISLVLDRSGSMAYASNERAVNPPFPKAAPNGWSFGNAAPNPSRWRDAVAAVNVFLTEMNNSSAKEWIALTTFNHANNLDQTLTTDYKKITDALDSYTNRCNLGSTNIAGGIARGIEAYTTNSRPFASKVMILLTDGIDTSNGNLILAAKRASANGIMIFAITFSNEADQATMKQVAAIGNGKHYHASHASGLKQIFQDIASQLPILISR
ncbi:MAG: vWA domain-containing protein [Pirellula staleyi]